MRAFIDTNIFVYASYSRFHQHHKALAFLKDCPRGSDIWCLGYSVIYEYLKVVTEKRLFSEGTLTLEKALANIESFFSAKNVEILGETEEHIGFLREMNRVMPHLSGGLLHDAHIVALMKEHSVKRIYTADTDFNKFSGITVVNPVQ